MARAIVRSAAAAGTAREIGEPQQDLLPSSPTTFFYRIFDATVEFALGGEGAVTGFVQRYLGRETRAKRIA